MSRNEGLDRRAFLRNAKMAALVGAVGTSASLETAIAFEPDATTGGKYDFDTPYNRIGTDCVKWDRQLRLYGQDSIVAGMGVADMDFRCAPVITRALAKRIQHENWGYLDMPPSFPDAIVSWNKRRYGIDINPDLMLWTTGVHNGIISALEAFSPPGSKILLLTPAYDGFYGDIAYVGCTPEECLMKLVNDRYSIDFEDLKRRISHDTNVLILCNPHNPTGNCWSREDLIKIGEICTERRVVVLADEIHCDFVTKGNKYTPYSTLADKEIVMNSITFKSGSKSFGLSALKTAWMFSDNAGYMDRVRAHYRQNINTLGMIATLAAYNEGEDWLDQLLPYIDANHDYAESFIRANIPLIKCVKAQGTYLAWLDVSALVAKIGAKDMAAEANRTNTSKQPFTPEMMLERWLVKNAKVQLNAGTNYGLGGAGHMRMNLATSRKTLELALNNMASALRKA